MGDFVDIISSPYPHGEGLPVYTDTQSSPTGQRWNVF
jgi:hypothetical protein